MGRKLGSCRNVIMGSMFDVWILGWFLIRLVRLADGRWWMRRRRRRLRRRRRRTVVGTLWQSDDLGTKSSLKPEMLCGGDEPSC
ncbi:hypothetical protein LINPERPRIM_LOCUS43211 [Linum perenne]